MVSRREEKRREYRKRQRYTTLEPWMEPYVVELEQAHPGGASGYLRDLIRYDLLRRFPSLRAQAEHLLSKHIQSHGGPFDDD